MSEKIFKCRFLPGKKYSAKELIEICVDGYDGTTGAIEGAQMQAQKCTEALGTLIQILSDDGILSVDQVYKVAGISGP